MENLIKGVKKFNKEYNRHRDLFDNLGDAQAPHSLFIGCCDSRIVPSLLTSSNPGELFVIRNVANMVPYFQVKNEFLSTTSAIEYAVCNLHVENIIVCGHSNCGGCNAMYLNDEELNKTPHLKKWLELGNPVKEKVEAFLGNNLADKALITEQMNIVEQMKHLLTYPYILEKYNNNRINILGWYYDIKTGLVSSYNSKTNSFIPI